MILSRSARKSLGVIWPKPYSLVFPSDEYNRILTMKTPISLHQVQNHSCIDCTVTVLVLNSLFCDIFCRYIPQSSLWNESLLSFYYMMVVVSWATILVPAALRLNLGATKSIWTNWHSKRIRYFLKKWFSNRAITEYDAQFKHDGITTIFKRVTVRWNAASLFFTSYFLLPHLDFTTREK